MALASPPTRLGTSSVKVAGPLAARWRTASMSAGVAAVLCATIRTRVVSMRGSFSTGAHESSTRGHAAPPLLPARREPPLVAHLAEDALEARLGLDVDMRHRRGDRG